MTQAGAGAGAGRVHPPSMLSKNTRVLALIALMAASSFGVGGAVYVVTSGDAAALSTSAAEVDSLRTLGHDLLMANRTQEAALGDFVLSRNPVALRRFDDAVALEEIIVEQVRATDGLPEVRSALELVALASLEWRNATATPAITAVRDSDAGARARFVGQSASDHGTVEGAIDTLDAALGRAVVLLDQRQASVAGTTMAGIVVAFGVLVLAFGVALNARPQPVSGPGRAGGEDWRRHR